MLWPDMKLMYDFYEVMNSIYKHDKPSGESEESHEEYFTNKSYHCLQHLRVNIFVLYCRTHGEGVAMELQYLCQRLQPKIPCCAVIKDTSCKMSSMLTGQIRITKLLVDEFDGYNDEC
jgi:hypothetical protein